MARVVEFEKAKAQRPRVPQALTVEEVLALPPPRWLIPGLLPAQGLVVLHGEPGTGKTFLALALAAAIARGSEWAGRRATQRGVLYVAGEGVAGLGVRIRAMIKAHGYDPGMRLRIVPGAVNVPVDVAALIEEIRRVEGEAGWSIGVVVLDTLARTAGGLDENSSEMGQYITACDQISAQMRGLVMVLHHPGKDAGRGMRGWSGIRGAIDMEIEVAAGLEGMRTITWRKQKDGALPSPLGFRLRMVETGERDEDGAAVKSCVVEMSDTPAPPVTRPRPSGARQQLIVSLAAIAAQRGVGVGEHGAPHGRPSISIQALVAAAAAAGKQPPSKIFTSLHTLLDRRVLLADPSREWCWFP